MTRTNILKRCLDFVGSFKSRRQVKLLRQSLLFDDEFYTNLAKLPRWKSSVRHFLREGWRLGLNPSPYFNTSYYLSRYLDVRKAGVNPLLHYLLYGWKEGRWPNPNFDPDQYKMDFLGARDSGQEPLGHAIRNNPEWLASRLSALTVPDEPVSQVDIDAVMASEFFDEAYYRSMYPEKVSLEIKKFEHRAPHQQNMLDIFSSRWATDCSFIAPGTTSGPAPHFSEDPRPRQADQFFGGVSGKRILELGPLEAAHTWLLVQLGVQEVVAVEANAEAFLKCLIVKELSGMKNARFLYGDMLEYLATRPEGFDAIFCSGVLYHMTDPVRLIELMSNVADQIFVWTHFIRPDHEEDLKRPGNLHLNLQRQSVTRNGQAYDYFVGTYADKRHGLFWGGNEDTCAWMTLDGLTQAFGKYGFDISILSIDEQHVNAPAITFGARRR